MFVYDLEVLKHFAFWDTWRLDIVQNLINFSCTTFWAQNFLFKAEMFHEIPE